MPPQVPTFPERVVAPLVTSPGSSSANSGSGLGLSGSTAASSLLVAQMLTGNVNAATSVAAPFGLIVSGEAMEGIEQVESGRSSASGTATIGDRETVKGDTSDQEMEGGNTTGSNLPNIPGYGDLRAVYIIVCVSRILQKRSTKGETGGKIHKFAHVKKADQTW